MGQTKFELGNVYRFKTWVIFVIFLIATLQLPVAACASSESCVPVILGLSTESLAYECDPYVYDPSFAGTSATGAMEAPEAEIMPEVTLTLNEDQKYANVAPGSDGIVIFNGTASAENIGPYVVEVSLTVCDTWAQASVEPTSLEFSPNDRDDKEFMVIVVVPLYQSCEIIGSFTVCGMVTVDPSGNFGQCNTVSGTILMEKYSRFQCKIRTKYDETTLGGKCEFEVEIDNHGNGLDNFSIEVDNYQELVDKGFEIKLSQQQITIEERERQKIKLEVVAPSGLEGIGKHRVIIKVQNLGSNQTITQFNGVVVNVELDCWIYMTLYISIGLIISALVIVALVRLRRRRRLKRELLKK